MSVAVTIQIGLFSSSTGGVLSRDGFEPIETENALDSLGSRGSHGSFFDAGYPGQVGELPDWPGADAYPSQPMVTQTRDVFGDRPTQAAHTRRS